MKYSVLCSEKSPSRDGLAARVAVALRESLARHGHQETSPHGAPDFLLHFTSLAEPHPVHRPRQGVHVVSVVTCDDGGSADSDSLRKQCYRALVRSMSNMLVCVVEANGGEEAGGRGAEAYFTTPEVGFSHAPFSGETAYRAIRAVIESHFAIENDVATDLPRALWRTSPVVEDVKWYGAELERLGVLPLPFPLRDVLDERDRRHLYRLFGVTGMSYGNLSARERVPSLGRDTFWMTGRGVDKARLVGPGRDLFLVTGVDEARGAIRVSVPPEHDAKGRVSVDAIEHAQVYRAFPEVGAIVHVHAWIDGVPSTTQCHPCGTRELATAVVDLLASTHDPSRAAVGLKNHGLTITGHDLEDVFLRIRGRLRTQVPMVA